jgi:2-polyprenyl-3-methyl-5-hydroxy-6-metoxy-1,4-benzoquinol methylase
MIKTNGLSKTDIQKIINWDIPTWSVILPYWEAQLPAKQSSLKCIEIGSRDGGITLWMTLLGYNMICSDLHYDLSDARKLHEEYGKTAMVEYKKVDILNWVEPNTYDVILIKSVLGALESESAVEDALKNVYNNLKPGGKLLFAENATGTIAHKFFRKYFTDWGSKWFYLSGRTLKNKLNKFSKSETRFTGVTSVFGNKIGLGRIFSFMDKIVFNKLLPDSMKYLAYGYSIK